MEEIYNMKLHEVITINKGNEVIRVPGGWIYTRFQLNQVMMVNGEWSEELTPTSVFVPFTDNDAF